MSYRTIKRLLGETSLERKCRFLFGSGLLLLITGSFYSYARLTSNLVFDQNTTMARLLISPILLDKHWKWSEEAKDEKDDVSIERSVEKMVVELKPEELKDYSWTLLKANLQDDGTASSHFLEPADYEALEEIRLASRERRNREVIRINREKRQYQYYGGVYASESCVECHRVHDGNQQLAEGDLLGMVKINFPLEKTEKALAWNNAILMATAIVTAFLAMLAAYAIVRYVIVKPVLHLKDVSDSIARGSLDQRADIRTGDEFEELSHAFNRMLRHLVTIQDELRNVNTNLDAKVDELAQVNLRLYEMNNMKNEFLATMSHELRTPLNSILGFSDVLCGASNLNEKQRRYVQNIQTSGKNLLNLINDVLDLAKIEAGKMELHPVEFSIGDLVERMVGNMLPMAEKKNIDVSWDIDSRISLLYQDVGKMQQILNNLLSNAIKFTPEGGRVRVRAGLRGDETLELVVEDTGIGIPLEDQASIFEKFRQGRSIPGQRDTLTREYEGTGLGLSIIKELSILLGGSVELESEFGKGSAFTVNVPVRLDEDAVSQPLEEPSRLVASGS